MEQKKRKHNFDIIDIKKELGVKDNSPWQKIPWNYPIIPKPPFRNLLVAPSNSGKTNWIMSTILSPRFPYAKYFGNRIYIFSRSLYLDDTFRALRKKLNLLHCFESLDPEQDKRDYPFLYDDEEDDDEDEDDSDRVDGVEDDSYTCNNNMFNDNGSGDDLTLEYFYDLDKQMEFLKKQMDIHEKEKERKINQKEKQDLKNSRKKEKFNNLLEVVMHQCKKIKKEGIKKSNTALIILDDMITDIYNRNRPGLIGELYMRGRHSNISLIITSQMYNLFPKPIRINCSHLCAFNIANRSEIKDIYLEHGGLMREKDFHKYLQTVWSQLFKFVYFDCKQLGGNKYQDCFTGKTIHDLCPSIVIGFQAEGVGGGEDKQHKKRAKKKKLCTSCSKCVKCNHNQQS